MLHIITNIAIINLIIIICLMIISHKHKFIFIKTVKTAGTSIEISLSRYCGKKDIITPLNEEYEAIRSKFNVYPQNYKKTLRDYELIDFKCFLSTFSNKNVRKKYYNHIPAFKIKELLNDKIWSSYYKFCFERNPWDKAVSAYYFHLYYLNINPDDLSFKEFVKNHDHYSTYYMYTINDEVVVDFTGKYENIINDLFYVAKKTGIAFDGWLPIINSQHRDRKKELTSFYDDEAKQIIYNKCQKEIELLDYKFETL